MAKAAKEKAAEANEKGKEDAAEKAAAQKAAAEAKVEILVSIRYCMCSESSNYRNQILASVDVCVFTRIADFVVAFRRRLLRQRLLEKQKRRQMSLLRHRRLLLKLRLLRMRSRRQCAGERRRKEQLQQHPRRKR